MTDLNAVHPVFEPILAELSEQHRDEVLAAFAAVEHSAHPVAEVQYWRCGMRRCAETCNGCSIESDGLWSRWAAQRGRRGTATTSPPS